MYTNVHMCIFHKYFVVFIYNVLFFYDPLKIMEVEQHIKHYHEDVMSQMQNLGNATDSNVCLMNK